MFYERIRAQPFMISMRPIYLSSYEDGRLDEKLATLYHILERCELCPRRCRVNRLKGERGYCRAGKELAISSFGPHFGEEKPLVGTGGSGTIFLTYCNLLCVYCQNYDISHLGYGEPKKEDAVADYMLYLQKRGCHNINLVTPTPFTPQLVRAIKIASSKGLHMPIVWNCGGYENIETIKMLEGVVDIYMPDIKYGSSDSAKIYSNAPDYFESCKEAVKEMYRQVGDLIIERGIAQRGLLVRHLVLPNNAAESRKVFDFIAKEVSKNTYLNIMGQYRPEYKAPEYNELNRHTTILEYNEAIDIAKELGLCRGEIFKHKLNTLIK